MLRGPQCSPTFELGALLRAVVPKSNYDSIKKVRSMDKPDNTCVKPISDASLSQTRVFGSSCADASDLSRVTHATCSAVNCKSNTETAPSQEEEKMSNTTSLRVEKPSAVKANLHGYVRAICMTYGMFLRQDYQGIKMRNEEMFGSAIAEMSRLGYIVIVEEKDDVHPWMPEGLVRTIKRVKRFPIWVPSPKMIELHGEWVCDRLKPTLESGKIVWHHTP